ncbi:MAG TPA: PaaI family thioesterase [Pyrinomonadaceae bacterium]|nr:PaaI family thioesterase [Pyrinomonadaceae bacterium]
MSALHERLNSVPITATLRIEVVELDEGYCETRTPRDLRYDGIFESFHGGLLMTVADTTACWAILTRAGAEARLTTTDMNIRFLAPCLSDLTAKARLIKFGRTLCPVEVNLFDAAGRHVAVAQVTYMLLSRRGE